MRFYPTSKPPTCWGMGLISLLLSAAVWADDLAGSDSLLCYGLSASRCNDEGCEVAEPWELNLPDFIKLDLRAKMATTTETAPAQRETEIRFLERNDGMIVLQGRQAERSFSWLITEATGEGTLTVSIQGQGITVFTVCTPTEGL